MKPHDTTIEDALQAKSFDSLAIKRIDHECYLVVSVSGVEHVLPNRHGGALTFRHAWQFREWLHSQFNIDAESIPVDTLR